MNKNPIIRYNGKKRRSDYGTATGRDEKILGDAKRQERGNGENGIPVLYQLSWGRYRTVRFNISFAPVQFIDELMKIYQGVKLKGTKLITPS